MLMLNYLCPLVTVLKGLLIAYCDPFGVGGGEPDVDTKGMVGVVIANVSFKFDAVSFPH